MPNIVKGSRMSGLLVYLCGPGRANEHTEPHLVGGDGFLMSWYDDAELNRDSALAIAGYLDKPRRKYGVEITAPKRDAAGVEIGRKLAHVWHCSLALEPGEGPLSDEQWNAIAGDFMDGMQFTAAGSGKSPARWAAIHHGLTTSGGDHIHIAASLVREDGTKVSTHQDQPRAQKLCNELEHKYGLRVLVSRETGAGMPGVKPAEQQRAARLGRPEPERLTIARTIRACAAGAANEAEFVRACRREGLLLRARFADGRGDVVVGYSAALKPVKGERPLYYAGGRLAKDLALPRLRELWPSTPELAAEAAAEWTAAKRGRRPRKAFVADRRVVPPKVWEKQADEVGRLREYLRSVPVDDRHGWAVVARQTAGVFAVLSRRTEPEPGPLAATSDALVRSAQMHYRLPRPKHTQPVALTAAARIILHAAAPGIAGQLVLLRQLANTMKAIHDMHVARADLKQALVLESAARGQLAQVLEIAAASSPLYGEPAVDVTSATAVTAEQEAAADVAVVAAVGEAEAARWRVDPAWPALQRRVADLAEQGFDPVATIRAARDMYELSSAVSVVEVMTWRIDKLVRDGAAPRPGTAGGIGAEGDSAGITTPALQLDGATAASAAVVAVVGEPEAATWRADPAWPALRQRIVDLADGGFDAAATIRAAIDMYELDTAASVVQVMTWRIDKLVRDGNAPHVTDSTAAADPAAAPGTASSADPDVAAALDTLRAASAGTPDKATSSPLPNPLPEPGSTTRTTKTAKTEQSGQRAGTSTPSGDGGADAQIGD
ncbi:relaxase/mobilization nuclease domain-containing protein [Kribbella sp. NPDC048928]|uniref:relaxase/mobilization nuclease domain-containing protein n=1 Tax=Kribbella sp. NPDC048928 TaxID=3364111 RepID=UPI0037149C00